MDDSGSGSGSGNKRTVGADWTKTIISSATEATRSFRRSDPVPTPRVLGDLPEGLAALPEAGGRYTLATCLVDDPAGRLWSGHDNLLDRPVLVRVLDPAKAADPRRLQLLLHEARITARLDHPGIVAIHDLLRTPAGELLLVQRQVAGRSLEEALAGAQAGTPLPGLEGWRQQASALVRACEGLAHAHERGVLHGDLKPAHLQVSDQGETVLTGWQTARVVGEGPPLEDGVPVLMGTPAYMSPEQARGEPLDPRSDVYALGAVLWRLLTGSLPTWGRDDEEFWHKKRAGVLDPPGVAQLIGAPEGLIQVARQALAADRNARHPSVRSFAAELAVAIERQAPGPASGRLVAPTRPLRRWPLIVAAALLLALAGAVAWRLWQQQAALGNLVFQHDFEDESWSRQLRVWDRPNTPFHSPGAGFTTIAGRLVSVGGGSNVIWLDRPLAGRVVVEFTGEVLPRSPLCDLSVLWTHVDPNPVGSRPWERATLLQVGSYDNECAAISLNGRQRVAMADHQLQHGRRYRMRFEIDGGSFAILVDGRELCRHEGNPVGQPAQGWVGLYAYYDGKAFDDLRIWCSRPPPLVPPTAVGDAFLRQGDWSRAEQEYRAIANTYPGEALGEEALFKLGLAQLRGGQEAEARSTWAALPSGRFARLAAGELVEVDLMHGRTEAAATALRGLYGAAGPAERSELDGLWAAC